MALQFDHVFAPKLPLQRAAQKLLVGRCGKSQSFLGSAVASAANRSWLAPPSRSFAPAAEKLASVAHAISSAAKRPSDDPGIAWEWTPPSNSLREGP